MKKISIILLVLGLFFYLGQSKTRAADAGRCTWTFTDENGNHLPPFYSSINKVNYVLTVPDYAQDPKATYTIQNCPDLDIGCTEHFNIVANPIGKIVDAFDIHKLYPKGIAQGTVVPAETHINVIKNGAVVPNICTFTYPWVPALTPTPSRRGQCSLNLDPSSNITLDKTLKISGKITSVIGMTRYAISYARDKPHNPIVEVRGPISKDFTNIIIRESFPGREDLFSADLSKSWPNGSYTATARLYLIDPNYIIQDYVGPVICSISFDIPKGVIPTNTPIPPTPTDQPGCSSCVPARCDTRQCKDCSICRPAASPTPPIPSLQALCDQIDKPGQPFKSRCEACIRTGGIWSALGCLPVEPSRLVTQYIFTAGLGIAGGIAFLFFIYGCFLVLTSAGNAEQVEEAKQIIISALSGFLLILFSIFFLKIIGVDILKIPGFE